MPRSDKHIEDKNSSVEPATEINPPVLSPSALYGLAGEVVLAIEPHTEADNAALLVQFLAAFSSLIGRTAHFRAEADIHYTKLFAVLVGVSSKGRKGSSWGHIKRLCTRVDESFENCVQDGLSSGEGLIYHVRDALEKQIPVKEKGKIVGYQTEIVDEGATLRERTYDDYSGVLQRYVRPNLGEKRLCDVRPLDIQNLYAEMTERGLSARTVRYTHAILSSAFKQGIKWQMLIHNPCAAIGLPRAERREMNAFAPKDAEGFLKAAKGNDHGVIFAFALATGMRPEEYLGLKWLDLDLDKGMAIVRRALVRRKGGGWYFGEPKTSRSRRTIPLPTTLVKMLTAHRLKQMAARLKAGAAYQNNDLVFATGEGTPHNSRNLAQRHFQAILKSANLALNFRLYDLRHSCATRLLVAGENPKVVSERLGHASVVLTLDTYSHVLPSMQREATEKLEKMLFSR